MLEALLHAKFRLEGGGAGDELGAAGHRDREDPLTATVFARLSYLPVGLAFEVLGQAVRPRTDHTWPGLSSGAVWHFWPSLRPGVDGRNARRVEPDVVVVDGARVVLFEAKHRGSQGSGQWREQLSAASRRWPGREPVLVAVGGQQPEHDAARIAALPDHLRCPVFRLSWSCLRRAVVASHARSQDPAQRRILRDIDRALTHWGYREPLSFGSLGAVARAAGPLRRASLRGWRPTSPAGPSMAGLVPRAAQAPELPTTLSSWEPT